MIKTTLLINNIIRQPLQCEHGLSAWCELTRPDGSECRILLDTGQHGKVLAANAEKRGIDLGSAHYAVVSHGHYDHAGGLETLAATGFGGELIIGRGATCRRYSMSTGEKQVKKENGMQNPQILQQMRVKEVSGQTEIAPGISVFTLPQAAPPNPRLIDEQGRPDVFADEIFTLITDGEHTMVYAGCTHHGVPQLMDYLFNHLHLAKLDLFVGGLHLMGRSAEEIDAAAREAQKYRVERWMTVHCTGTEAAERWAETMNVETEETVTL